MPRLLIALGPHFPPKYSPSTQYFLESPAGFSHVPIESPPIMLLCRTYRGQRTSAFLLVLHFMVSGENAVLSMIPSPGGPSYAKHSRHPNKHCAACSPRCEIRSLQKLKVVPLSIVRTEGIKQSLVYSNFSSLIRVQSLPNEWSSGDQDMTLWALGFSFDHPSFSIKSNPYL